MTCFYTAFCVALNHRPCSNHLPFVILLPIDCFDCQLKLDVAAERIFNVCIQAHLNAAHTYPLMHGGVHGQASVCTPKLPVAYTELVSGGFPKLGNLSGWCRSVPVLYEPSDVKLSWAGGGVSGQPKPP